MPSSPRLKGPTFAPSTFLLPAPASSACDLDFSAPDKLCVPTPRWEPLLRCAPAQAQPALQAEPAPPPVSQHSSSDQLQPFHLFSWEEQLGCRKQQRLAAASPTGSPPRLGVCAEPYLVQRTAYLYPAPGRPPLSPISPPGKICALKGLHVPLFQEAVSTGVIPALLLLPTEPGKPTAAAHHWHVGCVVLAATEGPCSLLASAWSRVGVALDVLCVCLVSGL